MLEFSAALQLEENGDNDRNEYVIVYMDESYIHQHHTTGRTWGTPGERIIRTGGGKGTRCIILHAITKHGLLFHDGAQRIKDDTHEIGRKRRTAEWVFVGPVKKGDYHKNMNEKNFEIWVEKRLIPLFEICFPGKRMILVMDNAPYHHIRDVNYIDPLQLKREGLFSELILTAKIAELTVQRGNVNKRMNLRDCRHTKKGTKKAPYNRELREKLVEFLKKNPQYQQDKLMSLFKSKNWQIIYTPPYTPSLQPIELLWAEVKRRVANRFKYGRSIKETRLQMLDAFYGIEGMEETENETEDQRKVRLGVTPELVKSYIDHSIKACQEFLDADQTLTGTIRNIQFSEPKNSEMSLDDQEVLQEPEDMNDQSDTYFGAENLDEDAEIEIDMQKVDDDSDFVDSDSDFESD